MAGRSIDYTAHLEADDQITPAAEKAADALDKLESQGDIQIKFGGDSGSIQADVENVLRLVDKLGGTDAAKLVLTSNAAEITNQIADLVVEVGRLDAEDPQIDIKVDNIQALESGLGQISEKAKQVVTETGGMGGAMSNTFGNAAQDLAGLAGITGSAGQAIGQLGDQFATAASGAGGLKSALAGVGASLGPIAAISAAVWVVTEAVAAFNAPAEAAAERTKQLGEAMAEGGDNALAFADVLRENSSALSDFIASSNDPLGGFGTAVDEIASKVPLIGGFFKEAGVDVFSALSQAGESVYSFGAAIDKGGESTEQFRARLQAAKDAGAITGDQFNAVSEAFDNYAGSAEDAASKQEAMVVSGDEVAAMLADIAGQADPLSVLPGVWAELTREIDAGRASGLIATDAVNQLSAALGMTPTEVLQTATDHMADLADESAKAAEEAAKFGSAYGEASLAMRDAALSSDAFAEALSRVNESSDLDFSQMAEDTVGSFDDMKASLTGLKDVAVDWSTVDLSPDSVEELRGLPDELAAVTDGISGMRDSIQTELQAAFDTGGIDAYTAKAQFFSGEVMAQFPGAFQKAGASAEQAAALTQGLLGDLQLLPENIQIMIELTREEEARGALDSFRSVIEQLPENVQVAINTKIAEGDITGALEILNSQLIQRGYDPIILPVDAEISAAVAKANEAQAYADSLVGTEAVDADIAAAQAAADAAKAHADSLTATMPLNADGTPAVATAAGVAAGIGGTPVTMPLGADPAPANEGIANVKATADATEGTVNVNASITDAIITMATINGIVAALTPPPIPITADASQAMATAAVAAMVMQSMHPTISIAADPSPAISAGVIAAGVIQALRPIITVAANPAPATTAGVIAASLIQALRPVMTIAGNPAPAITAGAIAAGAIASQRPVIPVAARLTSYPSAGEIAASIGTVRVPIDAYIRTMPRVTGAVPG